MGYLIYAVDDEGNCIFEICPPQGTFRMLSQQLYDWFDLIDAKECDGDVSGRGMKKMISLGRLEHALHVLLNHNPRGRLARNPLDIRAMWGASSIFSSLAPELRDSIMPKGTFILERGTVHEFEDTFCKYKPWLQDFMEACIKWCKAHQKNQIEIVFA
ncbi:MAG: hypothetical protein Q6373_016960 [Candidatus Sigynarchaeota archaeon]